MGIITQDMAGPSAHSIACALTYACMRHVFKQAYDATYMLLTSCLNPVPYVLDLLPALLRSVCAGQDSVRPSIFARVAQWRGTQGDIDVSVWPFHARWVGVSGVSCQWLVGWPVG